MSSFEAAGKGNDPCLQPEGGAEMILERRWNVHHWQIVSKKHDLLVIHSALKYKENAFDEKEVGMGWHNITHFSLKFTTRILVG